MGVCVKECYDGTEPLLLYDNNGTHVTPLVDYEFPSYNSEPYGRFCIPSDQNSLGFTEIWNKAFSSQHKMKQFALDAQQYLNVIVAALGSILVLGFIYMILMMTKSFSLLLLK